MMLRLLLILLTLITLNTEVASQYLYEEFPNMWEPISQVTSNLSKQAYELSNTYKEEDCTSFIFSGETSKIVARCCNTNRDSVTNLSLIGIEFDALMDIQRRLQESEGLIEIDTFICSSSTKIFRDSLDYEALLMYYSKIDLNVFELNYYSNFSELKEEYELIIKCDSIPTLHSKFVEIMNVQNSKGYTVQSYFADFEFDYMDFKQVQFSVTEFRNSQEFTDIKKRFEEHFHQDEYYKSELARKLIEFQVAGAAEGMLDPDWEERIMKELIQKENFIGIVLLNEIFNYE